MNLDEMEKAVWAVLFHYVSNPKGEAEQQKYCPKGEQSWCKWERNQEKDADEEKGLSNKKFLPPVFLELLTPTWKSLADRKLLERCIGGFTQNTNECLNMVLWNKCSKHKFHGRKTVQIAVTSAEVHYNNGATGKYALMNKMHIHSGSHSVTHSAKKDRKRLSNSQKDASVEAKRNRQSKRNTKKKAAEKNISSEGTTYAAGEFGELEVAEPSCSAAKKPRNK